MDKVSLSKEQLKVLLRFIHSRGFREPSTVVDILDHFACKVDEKLLAQKDISLEQAMHDAHRDFGVTGFRNLQLAHQAQFSSRYKRLLRSTAAKMLCNVPFLLTSLLLAFLYYKAYVWAEVSHTTLFGVMNVCSIAIWVVFFVGTLKIRVGLPKKFLNEKTDSGYSISSWNSIAGCLVFGAVQFSPGSINTPEIPAAFSAVTLIYLVFFFIAEVRTLNKLFENYRDIEHMLLELEN